MKKILTVLVLAIFTMSFVFATDVTPVSTLDAAKKLSESIDVTLNLSAADTYTFGFGFSNGSNMQNLSDSTNLASVPTSHAGTVTLEFDDADSTAKSASGEDLYLWYKVQYNAPIDLELSLTALTDSNTTNGPLGWTVYTTEDKSDTPLANLKATNAAPAKITVGPDIASNTFSYGSCKLAIVTDTIPALKGDAAFTATMTLKIATT